MNIMRTTKTVMIVIWATVAIVFFLMEFTTQYFTTGHISLSIIGSKLEGDWGSFALFIVLLFVISYFLAENSVTNKSQRQ